MKSFITFIAVALFCGSSLWAQDCDSVQTGACDICSLTEQNGIQSDGNLGGSDTIVAYGRQSGFDHRRGSQGGIHMGMQKSWTKAPGKNPNGNNGAFKKETPDFDRILSQKIAFFTKELDLSSEEAVKFWPVYNEYSKEQCAAHRETMKALKELKTAIRSFEKAACGNNAGNTACSSADGSSAEKSGKSGKVAGHNGKDYQNVTEKERDELAQKYIKALEKEKTIMAEYYPKFKNVVPVSKAAKIFSIEEKFRLFLIKDLKKH